MGCVIGIHMEIQRPVFFDLDLPIRGDQHPAAGFQFADAPEKRLVFQTELEGKVIRHALRAHLGGHKS